MAIDYTELLSEELIDHIVRSELICCLNAMEKEGWDIYETPDNKAMDIAALYRVLKYCMRHKDYEEFVKGRRNLT